MSTKRWKPGQSPYAEYLKTLTADEYEAHLEERRQRKAIKKRMEEVADHYQNEWVSTMHNIALKMAHDALETGDVQKFTALWDRIIGKPKDTVEVEGDVVLPLSMESFGESNDDDESEKT